MRWIKAWRAGKGSSLGKRCNAEPAHFDNPYLITFNLIGPRRSARRLRCQNLL